VVSLRGLRLPGSRRGTNSCPTSDNQKEYSICCMYHILGKSGTALPQSNNSRNVLFRPVQGAMASVRAHSVSREGGRASSATPLSRPRYDLWIVISSNGSSNDFTRQRRMLAGQRRDARSTNSYNTPALSTIGAINSEGHRYSIRPSRAASVLLLDLQTLASTTMALSMLGYRCCTSDLQTLPASELARLLEGK